MQRATMLKMLPHCKRLLAGPDLLHTSSKIAIVSSCQTIYFKNAFTKSSHSIAWNKPSYVQKKVVLGMNLEKRQFSSVASVQKRLCLPPSSLHHHHILCSSQQLSLKQHKSCDVYPINKGSHFIKRLHKESSNRQVNEPAFILSPQGIVGASPQSWQPYMRLMRIDRPIGTWLLFLPCTWSISLATPAGYLPDPGLLALFAMGSFFMRGAGCTINDMWDKDFDAKVARTKDRPLACGEVNMFRALTFLGAQLSVALAILLTFNWTTIALGACSVIPCVIYPLMKRVTYWPQIFLGITLNWGVLISWCAIHGSVNMAGWLLYTACALHTVIYDSIYSHQDKEDDILVGVKSTALGLGDRTKPWLAGFASVMVTSLASVGYLCDQTWPYFLGVTYVAAHMARQVYAVDLNNPEDCGKTFRSNRNLGIAFWFFIMGGTLLKKDVDKDSNSENDQ